MLQEREHWIVLNSKFTAFTLFPQDNLLILWRGREGDEIEEIITEDQITTSQPRRHSNSNSNAVNGNGSAVGAAGAVKSKFEVNDIDEEVEGTQ
jgi:hypothetical protein